MGKITNLNLKQKYEIIKMKRDNKSVGEISAYFKCGKTQVYNVLKDKEFILSKYSSANTNDLMYKKKRNTEYASLNEAVFEWFCKARSKNIPLSGPIVKEIALNIASKLNLPEFKASNGWLDCFRKRYSITFNTCCGEANEVNPNVVAGWKSKLGVLTDGYEPANVANCDESALFFKILPHKTLQVKGEKCSKGKYSKERITVLLTAFADGVIYKTAVIGKSLNPRCFKNLDKTKLPVKYFSNSKAWMTARIFEQYLVELNLEMERQNRCILLFLDNASSHPEMFLSNIRLIYFPPNTTAVLQPLDNGIIQAMKLYYRKLILKSILIKIDNVEKVSDITSTINILDAIGFLNNAIKMIKKETIQKCFSNCGFFAPDPNINLSVSQPNINELQNLIREIYDDEFNATEYINVDKELATESEEINLNEIIQEIVITTAPDCNSSENEDVEEVAPEATPSITTALKCLDDLKIFSLGSGAYELYEAVQQVEIKLLDTVTLKKRCASKQLKLDTYFIIN